MKSAFIAVAFQLKYVPAFNDDVAHGTSGVIFFRWVPKRTYYIPSTFAGFIPVEWECGSVWQLT